MITIKSHYWPETQNLRQIKFYYKDKLIFDTFMDLQEITHLIKQLQCIEKELIEVKDE